MCKSAPSCLYISEYFYYITTPSQICYISKESKKYSFRQQHFVILNAGHLMETASLSRLQFTSHGCINYYLLLDNLKIFCMFIVFPSCMSVQNVHAISEEARRGWHALCPRTGVTDGFEFLYMFGNLTLVLWKSSQCSFTAKPPLQPLTLMFFMFQNCATLQTTFFRQKSYRHIKTLNISLRIWHCFLGQLSGFFMCVMYAVYFEGEKEALCKPKGIQEESHSFKTWQNFTWIFRTT